MVASRARRPCGDPHQGVSIPFIAGQWSLPASGARAGGPPAEFQSPSLRGSGRFTARRSRASRRGTAFQSPSLRGSGRFRSSPVFATFWRTNVSIPFIAGQWSLRFRICKRIALPPCFNPLHCGAVVASHLPSVPPGCRAHVSIPFIAGQWSLQVGAGLGYWSWLLVSIPFIAGQWSLRRGR